VRSWWPDVVLVWVWMFGVWPIAEPDHNFGTAWGVLDIVLHFAALVALVARWKIVRRTA
jgi:hypothetical protein